MNPNVTLYSPITNLKTLGITGINYVQMNDDVISLNSYRGISELSIILINGSEIDTCLKNIEEISNRSTVCIVIVVDTEGTQYQRLTNIVDTIIPVKSNSDDIHSIVRSLVEPFTNDTQQIIGMDVVDIHYITRGKGIAQSITIDIESIGSLSKALSADYVQSSYGVLISIITADIDFSALERIDKIVRQNTNKDIAVISSFIEDKKITEGKIVLLFTGIH